MSILQEQAVRMIGMLSDDNVHALLGLFGEPKSARYHVNVERGIDTSGMIFCDYGTFQAVCIGAKDCNAPILSTIQGDQAGSGGPVRM